MRGGVDTINVKKISYLHIDQVIKQLQKIRSFTGHPLRFWPAFLELATRLSRARTGILLARGRDGGSWQRMHVWPAKEGKLMQSPELVPIIEQVSEASVNNNSAWDCKRMNIQNGASPIVLGLRLELDETEQLHAAVFILDEMYADSVEQTAMHLKMAADTPAIYQRVRDAQQAVNDMGIFSGALDLMVLLNAEKRYMAAAMTFVNEVASRYRCQRVSLGWLDSGYVRLQSVSHMERFEKKMDIVQTLEGAMEESFDQNEEIVWPPSGNSTSIARDHESYSKDQGIEFMLSVPMRLDDAPVGILTCERAEAPFTESDIRGIRVLCDQAARRLGDLRENDRWFGARIAAALRRKASQLVGVEHTFAKCIGLLVCSALVFLLFGKLPYRIEAPSILRSDNVRFIPAPFKGYIDEVHVDVGDQVEKGTLLLALDTGDLLLEESAAIANQIRYTREAEKARAENELAEMKIALALADQARARLELVRYHLSQSELRAPFSGIVVEGDLEDLLGAPVSKGDVLFKVSRIEKMYVELEVSERDIHEVNVGASGEMAFVSQPQLKFPIEVVRIDPVAVAKKGEGNVFRVRCQFPEKMADWWRPGMSGIAKINGGKRNVLWIVSHHTLDFFRMRLWW